MTPPSLSEIGARLLRNRRLMRAPIRLYRARLGFLFGSRLLMLEHLGRKSGVVRQVVLEVIGHPAPPTYIVASGFGAKSQWFRNVQANPRVRITVGRRTSPATARVLSTAEADAAISAYAGQHPRTWAKFKPVIESTLGQRVHEQGTALPMVAFEVDESVRRK